MKTSRTHRTPNKIRTALTGTALVAAAACISPVNAEMIVGAAGDDGSGPPGAFDGTVTATANYTVGGNRSPERAVNGSGIVLRSGDANERTNYVHDAGTTSFGDDFNFVSDIRPSGNWFKVDLGGTFVLEDAFFFNMNPNESEGALGNEDRGVNSAVIYYLDDSSDPNANNNGNDSAFDATGWTELGTNNFTIAPTGDVDQTVPDVINFGSVTARFVAVDILSNHGDPSFVGIGEIQFFGVQIGPPMIAGAIGNDGSGPPGVFDHSITASASTTISANRSPIRAINGLGILHTGGDPTDRTNYANDAGNSHFGNDINWGASAPTGWYKVDLGQTYTLSDALFFNFNPNNDEAPDPTNEDRGVDTANIWYLDAAADPNSNANGNDQAFDSTGWTQLGGVHNFTIAPTGDVIQTIPDVIDFGGVNARFVALDILSNHGDGGSVGIGEIQFFAVPDPPVDLVVIEDTLGVTFSNSVLNATYRLQSTPDLVSSNYSDTGAIAIGNGGTITMFDPTGTSTSKNYRVEAD
jgi:hypothetical protein